MSALIRVSCPCGLNRDEILEGRLHDTHGACTAYKIGSRIEVCDRLLAEHPIARSVDFVWIDAAVPADVDLGSYAVGTGIRVDCRLGGLSEVNDMPFYIRGEVLQLWSFLKASATKLSLIIGAPGVGKSVEVSLYALHVLHRGSRVIYMHGDDFQFNLMVGNRDHCKVVGENIRDLSRVI